MIGHFTIPCEAAKREYAVYVIVAMHRAEGSFKIYVGKTGDNNDGCNPIVSRIGNHLSFNKMHSQIRTALGCPEDCDFEVFYTTFGPYVPKSQSRQGLDLINAMERNLNLLAQDAFPCKVLKPVARSAYASRAKREQRQAAGTPERIKRLKSLIQRVERFLA